MSDFAFRPRSASEIIDVAVRLLRAHLPQAAILGAVAAAPSAVLQIVVRLVSPDTPVAAASFGVAALLGYLVLLVVAAIVGGATLIFGDRALRGEAPTVGEALAGGLRRAPTLLGVTIGSAFVTVVGFVLFFVPGVYVATRIVTSSPTAALEDVGPGEAINRAWSRSKGNAWHSFKVLLLAFLIYFIPLFVASALGGALAAVVSRGSFTSGAGFSVTGTVILAILQLAVSALAYPFLWFAFLMLYYDLRVRSEGYDLDAMAAAIDGTSPGGAY